MAERILCNLQKRILDGTISTVAGLEGGGLGDGLGHNFPSLTSRLQERILIIASLFAIIIPSSLKITKAEDVVIVPTYGHTDAHVSVVLIQPDLCYFFAGDSSYTQELMLEEKVDGVSFNEQQAIMTLKRIKQFVREKPSIYMPTHDPLSVKRLSNKEICASDLKDS